MTPRVPSYKQTAERLKGGDESAILFYVPFVTDSGHFILCDKASNWLFAMTKWEIMAFEESPVKLNFK